MLAFGVITFLIMEDLTCIMSRGTHLRIAGHSIIPSDSLAKKYELRGLTSEPPSQPLGRSLVFTCIWLVIEVRIEVRSVQILNVNFAHADQPNQFGNTIGISQNSLG